MWFGKGEKEQSNEKVKALRGNGKRERKRQRRERRRKTESVRRNRRDRRAAEEYEGEEEGTEKMQKISGNSKSRLQIFTNSMRIN